ncbi:hypothetical protein PHSC3_001590 [Chlamydiales bacterium STE3]|nr:hypothetical protein PHSC3_001590 [Chlamydiales bacterium STE3]
MKQELLELISLTKLFIHENYSLSHKNSHKLPLSNSPKPLPVKELKAETAPLPQRLPSSQPLPSLDHTGVLPNTLPVKELKAKEEPLPPKLPSLEKEPLPKIEKDFSDIIKIFTNELPHINIRKTPLDDTVAKIKSREWELKEVNVQALILFDQESAKEIRFLQNVADCLSLRFGFTKVISIQELNEIDFTPTLKCILSSKQIFTNSEKLQSLAKKNNTPFSLYEAVSHYFKNPQEKAQLWQTLSSLLG